MVVINRVEGQGHSRQSLGQESGLTFISMNVLKCPHSMKKLLMLINAKQCDNYSVPGLVSQC